MSNITCLRKQQKEPHLPSLDTTLLCVFMFFHDGGECEIEDIDPDDLQEWVDSFELNGAAEKAFKCLRQIIRWWVRKKRLHIADPTIYIELNSREPYRAEVLDATEVSDMLRGM